MKHYVLAHDLGTTGNKATLYDQEGARVGQAFYGYKTDYAQPHWAEQNPEDWWQSVCGSTQQLLKENKIPSNAVACVVFSGQMLGCVALDKHALPLRPAIIWADQRATAQEKWVAERLSSQEIYQITGHRLAASYPLNKILWLRDHQPELYKNTHKFVHAKDAMVARLTGAFVTDGSDASGMNLYDLRQAKWSEQILEATELNPAQLPEILQSIEVVGEVRAQVAEEVGVAAGTPVVMGAGDAACAATGAGVIHEGAAYNYVGSSSWISIATKHPLFDAAHQTFTCAHAIPDMFMPMGTMQAAGAAYQWLRDQLGLIEKQTAEMLHISPYELMNTEAMQAVPGANGLIFLPYLMGERSPWWNTKARGAFIGLTIRHTRSEMFRAVLEGITMNLRLILQAFRAQTLPIEGMRVIGGGTRSRLWNQMMADMYEMPVYRLRVLEEATSMGAALVGGVGVGLYPDFSMAFSMNPVLETLEPNRDNQAAYRANYPIFESAYRALVPIYEQLSQSDEISA